MKYGKRMRPILKRRKRKMEVDHETGIQVVW